MAAAGRLDREAERLHAAWTREAAGDVVRRVRTVGKVHGDALLLPSHTQRSGRLAVGASLQLVPIVGTGHAGSWGDDYGDVIHALRYTLPAEPATAPDAPAAAPDSLPALLGSGQAAVLRALERPMYAGPLAERLFLTPSGLSHHLNRLEAAGLVRRTRRGRRVLVRRTSRAVSLLLLYED
jgi:hypothetical protein